jgi:crotonobetainyl-CoA:carnitine CoA-transferase CaiB-like acyl-CoA transferase
MTRLGNRDRYTAPANLFRAKDGRWVYLAAGNDSLFPQLLKAMGQEDVLKDPRFAALEARMAHIEESEEVLAKWAATKTAEEIVAVVRGAGLPCAKVASIDEVVANPQVRHRGMLVEVEHPTAGKVPMQGLNIHFSDTPKQIRRPPPLLGQHNEEIYGRWLGLAPSEVARLKADGVI